MVALDVEQLAPLMQGKRDAERTLELPIVGKGKHIRTIFISPRAAHWIRASLATRGDDLKPLFINSRSRNPEEKRLSPRAIQLLIAKYARLAGLSKKVTPHTMRHTYATEVPPLSWTPKHLCFRSPRCRRNAPHTRLSSGGR